VNYTVTACYRNVLAKKTPGRGETNNTILSNSKQIQPFTHEHQVLVAAVDKQSQSSPERLVISGRSFDP
jgi:hypothetical protein